jgi:membrane protein DedA with SNARE-associated domain
MHALIALWFGWVRDWGYGGIIVLMAMESTIFPVPSEVVIPPAAYWVNEGHMTLFGVILAGTLGSYLGSALTYWLARWVGRAAVVGLGRRFLITEEKIERAERFLQRYEAGGVFFARLLPVVRHLISIPAGIFRMKFGAFSVMTIVGSALWCSVLAWMGARMAQRNPGLIEDPEKMIAAMKHESLWFVLMVLGMAALYALTMRLTAKSSTSPKT